MLLLPKKVGPFTLMRKLSTDGVTETYVGILEKPAGKQVIVRRLLPHLTRSKDVLGPIEDRIADLRSVSHPALLPILDYVSQDDDRWLVEDWAEAVTFRQIIDWQASRDKLPHHVYLNLAVQACNAIDALHGHASPRTGADLLHMGLSPTTFFVTPDGRVLMGQYGLLLHPTSHSTAAGVGASGSHIEYLAPEQTHQDQALSPSTDLFSLAAILYEALVGSPLFREPSNFQTILRIRTAEVNAQLLAVKEMMPGLDKVLYRALSLNPRHRYQRSFVLREDLRGLMATFSFANIETDSRTWLAPLFGSGPRGSEETLSKLGPDLTSETTGAILQATLGNEDAPAPTPRRSSYDDPSEGLPLSSSTEWFQRPLSGQPAPEDSSEADIVRAFVPASNRPESAPPAPPRSLADSTAITPLQKIPFGGANPESVPPIAIEALIAATQGAHPDRTPEHGAPDVRGRKPRTATPPPVRERARAPGRPEDVPEPQPAPALDPAPFTPERAPGRAESPPKPPVRTDKRRTGEPPPPRPVQPPLDEAEPEAEGSSLGLYLALAGGALIIALLACAGLGGGGVIGVTVFGASKPAPVADNGGQVPATNSGGTPVAAPSPEPEPEPEPVAVAPSPRPPPRPTAPEPAAQPAPQAAPEPVEAPRPTPRPEPEPEPAVAMVAPKPVPVAVPDPVPAPRPAPRVEPEPEPEPVAIAPMPKIVPVPRPEPLSPAPAVKPGSDPAATAKTIAPGSLDQLATVARSGALAPDDRAALEATNTKDGNYTRAYVLLYEDAKARGDTGARIRYLQSLMTQEENRYNPVLLTEEGELAVRTKDWKTALSKAELAERHWARLPSDLVFSRKVMIYEIQASAHEGLFNASSGEDLDSLQRSIRDWERYKRHAETRSRGDLVEKADAQLNKLYAIQARLE
jgi:serine/threonine protein kinase